LAILFSCKVEKCINLADEVKIPGFLIIGAPKCGTTALWHFLNQHPGVCMSENKEPRFFSRVPGSMEKKITGDGPRLSGTFNRGYKWYASLFKNCKEGQLTGEASTIYFATEDSPGLIHNHDPGIKLILMLRHPVKRLYSHYWQEHKLGFEFPSFGEMVQKNNPRYCYYKKISHYKQNLERYFQFFKREQILILIQEEFNEEPETHLNKVYSFLNIASHSVNVNDRINEQVTPKHKKLAFLLMYLRFIKVNAIVPGFILERLKKFRTKLIQKNAKPFKYEPLDESLFKQLYQEFVTDIEYIETILGRSIKSWHY